MGLNHPKLVSWAAGEGRVDDLIYHLGRTGPSGLRATADSEKRRTPLMMAAIRGQTKCISVLFDAGAALNEQDTDGFTALHLAAGNGHLYAVQLLLDIGANPYIITRFGIAPIHLATSSGHTQMIQLLASHNADINAQESWGQTPLMIATQQSRIHCMRTLIKSGCDLEIHDHHHGNTALHVACTTKDEETLLTILDGGANVLSINKKGLSTLGAAIENKFYRGISLLLEYGARLNSIDEKIASSGLQNYLNNCTTTPLSLLRLSRVAVRRGCGPYNIEAVTKQIPDEFSTYINAIRDDCCKVDNVKHHALIGCTVTTVPEKASTKF
jgi:ankyrin repeat protein